MRASPLRKSNTFTSSRRYDDADLESSRQGHDNARIGNGDRRALHDRAIRRSRPGRGPPNQRGTRGGHSRMQRSGQPVFAARLGQCRNLSVSGLHGATWATGMNWQTRQIRSTRLHRSTRIRDTREWKVMRASRLCGGQHAHVMTGDTTMLRSKVKLSTRAGSKLALATAIAALATAALSVGGASAQRGGYPISGERAKALQRDG